MKRVALRAPRSTASVCAFRVALARSACSWRSLGGPPLGITRGGSRGRRQASSASSSSRLPDLEDETQPDFVAPAGLSPSEAYELHVSHGSITRDPRQQAILPALDRIYHAVVASTEGTPAWQSSSDVPASSAASTRGGMSMMWSLFGRMEQQASAPAPPARSRPLLEPGTRGVYLWGGTGTGKTWLMDLLFHAGAA